MNKYNDIEIQTAKILLKARYKWIARYDSGRLFAFSEKPIKSSNNFWATSGDHVYICRFVPIFQSVRSTDKEPVSLENIVHPHILDEAEKRYLKGVIRPFRDDVKSISKGYTSLLNEEFIVIRLNDREESALPYFKAETMYKGMERGKRYTLEELGL